MSRYQRPTPTRLRANIGILAAMLSIAMFFLLDFIDVFSIDRTYVKMLALAGGVLAAFLAAALGGEG